MSTIGLIGSLVFVAGALVLAWRGVAHLPKAKLVRYALAWMGIFAAMALLLSVAGA